jgi:hypothetical protein
MRPEERAKIIKDNKLCPFCLLHRHDKTEVCQAKANKSKPACGVTGVEGSTACGCMSC